MARAEDNVIVVPGRRQWPRRDVVRGQKLSSFLVCTLETANHADCPDCIPDPFARRGLRAIIILALMAASYIRPPGRARGSSTLPDSLPILWINRRDRALKFDPHLQGSNGFVYFFEKGTELLASIVSPSPDHKM